MVGVERFEWRDLEGGETRKQGKEQFSVAKLGALSTGILVLPWFHDVKEIP